MGYGTDVLIDLTCVVSPHNLTQSSWTGDWIDQNPHPDLSNPCNETVYYHRPGKEDGVRKWLIYWEGGGWCANTEECYDRYIGNWPCMYGIRNGRAARGRDPEPPKPNTFSSLLLTTRQKGAHRPGQLPRVRPGQGHGVGHADVGPRAEPAAALLARRLRQVLRRCDASAPLCVCACGRREGGLGV